MKTNIETTSKLLQLRGKLQSISEISFSFATLNRQYPIGDITEEEAQSLLETYHKLMERVGSIYSEYEDEKETDKKTT